MYYSNRQMNTFFKRHIATLQQFSLLHYFFKWLLLSLLIGVLSGCASAFFLISLEWVTNWRENHLWIIALLPLGGLLIGLLYHYYGTSVVKGNNLLLEELHSPKEVIPFKMAPLVLLGTLITHLFGGSAGREGTAVQMGGAIADQFTHLFRLTHSDRKILIIAGISGGFASVFGTPLAGAVFALEVMVLGRIRYQALFPAFLTAYAAHYTCLAWGIGHTLYEIPFVPDMSWLNFIYAIGLGIVFGLTAMLFSKSVHFLTDAFKKTIAYVPLRPFIGGIVIAMAIYLMGTTRYIGLGIPVIVDAFSAHLSWYDFLLKILFTAFTLGAGFKGGEVTPLFFIGAVLGNVLSFFVPFPVALLAGMGFVGVFSGATNTPLACIIMGMELFGFESSLYIAIACIVAYFFSGHSGIYTAQIHNGLKQVIFKKKKQ